MMCLVLLTSRQVQGRDFIISLGWHNNVSSAGLVLIWEEDYVWNGSSKHLAVLSSSALILWQSAWLLPIETSYISFVFFVLWAFSAQIRGCIVVDQKWHFRTFDLLAWEDICLLQYKLWGDNVFFELRKVALPLVFCYFPVFSSPEMTSTDSLSWLYDRFVRLLSSYLLSIRCAFYCVPNLIIVQGWAVCALSDNTNVSSDWKVDLRPTL